MDTVGNKTQDLVRDLVTEGFGLFSDDSDPGFKIRGINISDQATFKTGTEPFFKGWNFFGGAVTADDDLLIFLV